MVLMITCKHCQSLNFVKSGFVRDQQRYLCKDCHRTFVCGDKRVKPELVAKRALAVILYALGKSSFRFLAKIFDVSPSLVYRWIVREAEPLPEPTIPNDVKEMEFDEMWHFIGKKKQNFGSSKPWIVAQGELWHGSQVIVMLQPSNNSMTK
jgi:transposase